MRVFGDPRRWPSDDLVGWSSELTPELALAGYREGVFPMPVEDVFGWFSPLRRGVLPLDGLHVTRSMRRSARRYRVSTNRAFSQVLAGCADPARPGGWIDASITDTYRALHEQGIVHSVEVWDDVGRLVGGVYGVCVGRLFAGESMFHHPVHGRDASKVALMALVGLLNDIGVQLFDVQWRTEHLASLGVIEVPRELYLRQSRQFVAGPAAKWPLTLTG